MNDDALKIAQIAATLLQKTETHSKYWEDELFTRYVERAKRLYELSQKAVATK